MTPMHGKTSSLRRALWDERVVAEAASTITVDGREYFAPDAVDWDRLEPSEATSVCHWKGVATYYDLVDGDDRLPNAAWTYADPSPAAAGIKGHIGFWRGVKVVAGTPMDPVPGEGH